MHVVARIGKPHGLRGEVTIQPHTDVPGERFVAGAEFTVQAATKARQRSAADSAADEVPRSVTLRSVRVHQGVYLLAFEGVPDRTAAEGLRGYQLVLPETGDAHGENSLEGGAQEEAWYEQDLLGFSVVLADDTPVGEVSALQIRPYQDLLEIRHASGSTSLVPLVREIVTEIDEGARRVTIDPPGGLLDLGEGQ